MAQMTDLTDGRLADNLVLLAVRCDLDGDELGCAAALRQASKRIRELARSPGGASDELENTKRLFSAECNDADRLLSRLLGCKPEDFPAEYRSEGGFLRTGKIENAIRERIAPEPSEQQDAARYRFLRGLHDPGPDDPRVHTLDQQHDPVQVRLCFGDDLDAVVDAAMRQP